MAAYMTTRALTPVARARLLQHTRVAAAAHPEPLGRRGQTPALWGEPPEPVQPSQGMRCLVLHHGKAAQRTSPDRDAYTQSRDSHSDLQRDDWGQLGSFRTSFVLPGEQTQHTQSWRLPTQGQVFSFNVTAIIILLLELFWHSLRQRCPLTELVAQTLCSS